MQQRLEQVIKVINAGKPCEAVDAAIDDGMEILFGGMRPLPSKDLLEETLAFNKAMGEAETRMAAALERFATGGGCGELHRRALDLKIFVEEMNEVANVVGRITAQCGVGDSPSEAPCDDLKRVLDEDTGEEMPVGTTPQREVQPQQIVPNVFRPSYSVKLRSPFVPPWFGSRTWEEDVVTTDPIKPGECVAVFKETRGLMLKLHLDRIIAVTDPWVPFFNRPRGTKVPIWSLQWIPSEYVKEWHICNTQRADGTVGVTREVTQRVKQDIPLTYFWRFFARGGIQPTVRGR